MTSNNGTHSNVHVFVTGANMPQLGSFGECVFANICRGRGMHVEPIHAARHDFQADGRRVDVKTSRRRLNMTMTAPHLKVRHKVDGVEYAAVEFCESGAYVSLAGTVLGMPRWDALESLFQRWKTGEFSKVHASRFLTTRGLPMEVRGAIEQIFLRTGLPKPYLLYRTVMFDAESPHNLLPSQRSGNNRRGWTVLIVFSEAPPTLNKVAEIIAFPDTADASLPRLTRIRASRHIEGLEKADLSQIPSIYRFKTLELFESYLTSTNHG